MASRHLAPFFAFFIFMTSLFMPSKSYAVNGTTTAEASSGGSEVVLTVGNYLATLAAVMTVEIINEGRKIISQKDFARNLGMKIVEFGRGIKFACRRPDQIKQMLSDQMTQDMRRILETAMNQGLKRQAYDGDQSRKFTPGYFGSGNEFFAWQNVFSSTLVKDAKAPGLLIYIPADRDDFVREDELTSIDDRKTNSQHQRIIKQLLNQILPSEDKRSHVLKRSLEILDRVFMSGAFRVASYYGEDERKTKELKKVPNGVQVLRILNPSDREGRCIDLLGTLLYFPDLGQRVGDKVDIMQPLLSKPANVTETEWKKTLPNRVRWFLRKKRSSFLSGSRKIEQGIFTGPITYSDPEKDVEVIKGEEKARIHEAHRIHLEAVKRALDQWRSRTRRNRQRGASSVGLERERSRTLSASFEGLRVSPFFERQSHERQAQSLTRSVSPPMVVRTVAEDSFMLSRGRSRSLSDMRLQTTCEHPSRTAPRESLANWQQSQMTSRSSSPLTDSPHWLPSSDRFCEQMLDEEIAYASREAAACRQSSQQAAEMARESRGMAEERSCSPGYSDIDFSDEEPEDYPLGNTGSSRLADEERLTSVLVTWEL